MVTQLAYLRVGTSMSGCATAMCYPTISNQRPGRPHTAPIAAEPPISLLQNKQLSRHTPPSRPIKLILGSWRLDRISFHSHCYSTLPTAGNHHPYHSSTPTFHLFIYPTIRGTTYGSVVLSRPSIPHHVHGAGKSEWNCEIPFFFIYLLTEEAALTVLLGLAEDAVTSFWGTNDWSCRLNMHKGQRTGWRVGLVKRAVKKAPLSLVCLSSERWCMDDGC
jgi:hypothetical protein